MESFDQTEFACGALFRIQELKMEAVDEVTVDISDGVLS